MFASLTTATAVAAGTGTEKPIAGPVSVLESADRISTSTTPTASSPWGQSAPRGDFGPWKQVFVDDFTTDIATGTFPGTQAARYRVYPSGRADTSGDGRYAPEKVLSVADGLLRKHVRTEDGTPLVAAVVPLIGPGASEAQLYGRYSVRFRADRTPGYKVVWLLWPDEGTNITGSASGRGGNGEVDFPEMDLDDDEVSGFVHHQDATDRTDQYWSKSDVDVREWHTYTIEWSPDLVTFMIDGDTVGRTTERIPRSPMRFTLQTETSLRAPTPDWARGVVEIDWISIWSHSPTGSVT